MMSGHRLRAGHLTHQQPLYLNDKIRELRTYLPRASRSRICLRTCQLRMCTPWGIDKEIEESEVERPNSSASGTWRWWLFGGFKHLLRICLMRPKPYASGGEETRLARMTRIGKLKSGYKINMLPGHSCIVDKLGTGLTLYPLTTHQVHCSD